MTSILLFWGDFIKWTATLDSVLFSAVHWWSRLMAVRIYTFLWDLWPPLHSKDPLLRLAPIQAPGSALPKMQIRSTQKPLKPSRKSIKLYIGHSVMLRGRTSSSNAHKTNLLSFFSLKKERWRPLLTLRTKTHPWVKRPAEHLACPAALKWMGFLFKAIQCFLSLCIQCRCYCLEREWERESEK